MPREPVKSARGVSRRSFIRQAAAGAGAVAAGSAAGDADQRPPQRIASDTAATRGSAIPPPPAIRVPDELIAGSKAPAVEIQFPMTGAQVFARACKEEGVAALFCCPGNYGVIHAIANIGIPTFSGRHEGAMTHAADAFIRVSGEQAVASGTEGAGFTDMICGIACANAARAPLLVVASDMALFQEDTEAGIQLAYQQPTTDGMKKYGKRLVTPSRVHEYTAYAFRQRRSAAVCLARSTSAFRPKSPKVGSSYTDAVHPAVIAQALAGFLYRRRVPKDPEHVSTAGDRDRVQQQHWGTWTA